MVVLTCLKNDCEYSTEDVKEQIAMSLLQRHSASHSDNSDWPPPESGFTDLYVAVQQDSFIKTTFSYLFSVVLRPRKCVRKLDCFLSRFRKKEKKHTHVYVCIFADFNV